MPNHPSDKPIDAWVCMNCVRTQDTPNKFQLNYAYFCKHCEGRWITKNDPNHIEYMLCRHTLLDDKNKPILDAKNHPVKCMKKNAVANTACVACRADLPNKNGNTELSSQTPVLLIFSGEAKAPWICTKCGVISSVSILACHPECEIEREDGLKIFRVPSMLDPSA